MATGKLGVGSTFMLVVPKQPGHTYIAPIKMPVYPPDPASQELPALTAQPVPKPDSQAGER